MGRGCDAPGRHRTPAQSLGGADGLRDVRHPVALEASRKPTRNAPRKPRSFVNHRRINLDEAGTGTTMEPHTFTVLLEVPDLATIDRQLVEAIIQSEKPAHTAYTLEIRAARPAA